jgi:hypothetical protein
MIERPADIPFQVAGGAAQRALRDAERACGLGK